MSTPSACIKSSTALDNDLLIEFTSGKTYQFNGMAHHADSLARASSPGTYFNVVIRAECPRGSLTE
jgi:hypothetical protein